MFQLRQAQAFHSWFPLPNHPNQISRLREGSPPSQPSGDFRFQAFEIGNRSINGIPLPLQLLDLAITVIFHFGPQCRRSDNHHSDGADWNSAQKLICNHRL